MYVPRIFFLGMFESSALSMTINCVESILLCCYVRKSYTSIAFLGTAAPVINLAL